MIIKTAFLTSQAQLSAGVAVSPGLAWFAAQVCGLFGL
jgi:hypothetical protein